jgi:hypothetical protein
LVNERLNNKIDAMKILAEYLLLLSLLVVSFDNSFGQPAKTNKNRNAVYVDKEGVMRWTADKSEASFFGVNYTTPFAYAYRAHDAVNADLENAIRNDVYHMARLGLDAFRVHVWDNEISDIQGNLLENEHLRLFDFLLAELKKRRIKTIITPIAFWGNGYPERDQKVPGFSSHYGRGKLTTNDSAIAAQENYLRQFFSHVNRYTNSTYQDDPDVIAVEINNEPSHTGPKEAVTAYVNRLAAAIKSTGWSKPVFYNISQGPYYADAVAASNVDGFSFQWYPSGLVSGKTLKGNYLPHVDKYTIPFDTIPAFRKKALMVYEFDAADILQPVMYPFMAKSFRQAGFQWATQFAYDPMAIAHANTEYQTHYLNLAYTPAKAISLMIASRVFHHVPRLKDYGHYPADSVFDAFRVSYKQSLSEMNTEKEFYYSNSTGTKPANVARLQHLAGVGTSPVVTYSGSGAYFVDRLETGVWRLEVMPDVVVIRDPFEKASPRKEVARVQWNSNRMRISLPDLGSDFSVKPLNTGNKTSITPESNGFEITPGTYLLTAKGKQYSDKGSRNSVIGLEEFVAPTPGSNELVIRHEPLGEVTANKSFTVHAVVVGSDPESVSLLINRMGGQFKNIPMNKESSNRYVAQVPADFVVPGVLTYRIVVKKGSDVVTFPGNVNSDPGAWDDFSSERCTTYVAQPMGALSIFDATHDHSISTYPTWRRGFQTAHITAEEPSVLVLQMTASEFKGAEAMGFQHSVAGDWNGRAGELSSFDTIVVRARVTGGSAVKARIVLIGDNGSAFAADITLDDRFSDVAIPLTTFASNEALLMPRPYPGFLPLKFRNPSSKRPDLSALERIEITIGEGIRDSGKPFSLEVAKVWAIK